MEMAYSKKDDPIGDRWDDFRFFVAVANSASIKRAAAALGTTQSAVSKRIDRLERMIGTKLFDRGATGTRLTYQGERILPHVLSAQRELSLAQSEAQGACVRIDGDCSILLSDGIANYWLSQFLPAFFDAYPDIELKLILDHDLSAPRNEIFDIRLHYFEPSNPEQIARPLASVHFMPFASRDYIKRYGLPQSIADFRDHRVLDLSQYLTTSGSWSSWFGSDINKATSLFTNQSSFLVRCVANGAGIALMPTYMTLVEPTLVPLDLGMKFRTKLFASYHRERALKQPVRTMLSFLRAFVFEPKVMPWFFEEFAPPADDWASLLDARMARLREFRQPLRPMEEGDA